MSAGTAATDPQGSLRVNAVRGTAVTLSTQFVFFLINVIVSVTLARLLTPEAFGVFGIAFALTGFFEFAKNGGLLMPMIQRPSISAEQISTLFWINVGLGFVLFVGALVMAPLAAYVYTDTRLVAVISALACTFIVAGFSTQHLAVLRRQMRFSTIAWCEFTALIVASALAIVMARRGATYWALVGFHLGREVTYALLVSGVSGWWPSWHQRTTPVRPLLRSGILMMLFELLGYLNFKADNLVVGWALGPVALGFYSKAYEFCLQPINQVTQPMSGVLHSALSRSQADSHRYSMLLVRALFVTTALGLPATAFLFANADTIIVQLLGEPWRAAASIARALAPAAACVSITSCVGWIFLSLDRGRRQLPWSLLTTALTIGAFSIGTLRGAVGVATAFSVIRVLLLIPTLAYTCHGTSIRWQTLVRTVAQPAIASATALIALLWLSIANAAESLPGLALHALVFCAVYVGVLLLMPQGRAFARDHAPNALWR